MSVFTWCCELTYSNRWWLSPCASHSSRGTQLTHRQGTRVSRETFFSHCDRVVAGSQATLAAAAPTAIFYLSQKFRLLTSLFHSTVLHDITCCKPSMGIAFELLRKCKSFMGCIIPAQGVYTHGSTLMCCFSIPKSALNITKIWNNQLAEYAQFPWVGLQLKYTEH